MTKRLSRMARWLVPLALLALAVATPREASADAYDAALARAIAAKERALELNDPPRWDEALRLFGEADRIRSTKESKYELGFAAVQMHAYDLAVESYEAALDLGIVGTARARAEAFIAEHAAKMGRVEVVGPQGTAIYVREQNRGVLPLPRPLVLFPGAIDVAFVRQDGSRDVERVAVGAGALAILRVTDRAPSAAPAASHAKPPSPSASSPRLSASSGPVLPPPANAPSPPLANAPSPPLANAPSPSDRSIAAASYDRSRLPSGWPFVISGLVLAAAGGATVALTTSSLGGKREELDRACAKLQGTDECSVSRTDQKGTQDLVDAIATLKAVQIGGWVGVGTGAAVALVGAVLMLGNRSAPQPHTAGPRATAWQPEVRLTRDGAVFLVGGLF